MIGPLCDARPARNDGRGAALGGVVAALVGFSACAPPPSPPEKTSQSFASRSCPGDRWSKLYQIRVPFRRRALPPTAPKSLWYGAAVHVMVLPTDSDGPPRVVMIGEAKVADDCQGGDEKRDWATWEFKASEPSGDDLLAFEHVEPKKVPQDSLVCSGHAFLPNGTLITSGGTEFHHEYAGPGLDYAAVLDAKTSTWRRTPDMRGLGAGIPLRNKPPTTARWYPTNTALPDGTHLITGGFEVFDLESRWNLSVETYDWRRPDDPWKVISSHDATTMGIMPFNYTHVYVLPNPPSVHEEILMMGDPGELWFFRYTGSPPDRQRWRPAPDRQRPGGRINDGFTSMISPILDPGPQGGPVESKIIVAGGRGTLSDNSVIDVYDVRRKRWERAIDAGIARHHPDLMLLPDGNVLLVNGRNHNRQTRGDPTIPQVVNPKSWDVCWGTSWNRPIGSDATFRGYHNVAALLPDGRVLISSGQRHVCFDERPDLRYYYPPYLGRKEARPQFDDAPPWCIEYGKTYRVKTRNSGLPIDGVALMGYSAQTHSIDMGARYVQLVIEERNEEAATLIAPQNATIAPPGPYMMFLQRDFPDAHWSQRRLPSRARRVFVAESCRALRPHVPR